MKRYFTALLISLGFLLPVSVSAACSPVALGGTGNCALGATFLLIGNGTSPIATSSTLFFTTALNRLSFTNASSSVQTISSNLYLTALGTAAGTFLAVDPNGKVIATSTPSTASSTLLSDNNTFSGTNRFTTTSTTTFNAGISFSSFNATGTATSTAANGVNLSAGCFAINGTCLSAGGGTVTSITAGTGLNGGTINTSGTISLISYLATSSSETKGQLPYYTSTAGFPATFGTISTSSLGVTAPITFSGTIGAQIGGAAGSFGCTSATASVTGCLTAADFAKFNAKVGTSTADTVKQIAIFGTTNATPALIGGSSALTFSTSSPTNLLTATNASTTNLSAGTSMFIPNGSSQTAAAAGQVAEDTTDKQLIVNGGVHDIRRNLTLSMSTTTAWTGTSSIPAFVIPQAMTLNTVQCSTDVGTLNVQFKYGNNVFPAMFQASTTVGTIIWASNNTPAAGATSTISFGTPGSSPTQVSCTIVGTITAT